MTLIADNPFISKKELVPFEKGIRIDYILFKVGEKICLVTPSIFVTRVHSKMLQSSDCIILYVLTPKVHFISFNSQGSSKVDIHCDSMSTTKGSVPDHAFPYSDHEALTAELRLDTLHTPTGTGSDRQSKDQECDAGISLWHVATLDLYSGRAIWPQNSITIFQRLRYS